MGDTHGTVRLGAAQVAEVYLDREATIAKDCEYIREAGRKGVDVLVFPEFHVAGSPYWFQYDDDFEGFQQYYRALFDNAVTVPGPATERLCAAAREAGVAVVVGVNEKRAGTAGTMYNSQVFVDADGTLLGVRRKLMPTREERLYHAGGTGEDVRTFESSVGTLGGLMCGEHTNPLAVYATLALGEELHAAAWPAMPQPERDPAFRERHIYARTRYHAFAGKMPTASATGVVTDELADAVGGMPDTYADSGTTAVIGADGAFLAGPKHDGEGIVHADVDMADRVEGKAYHDVTGHYNRFDVFELAVDRRPHEPIVDADDRRRGAPRRDDDDVAEAVATLRAAADRREDPELREHVEWVEGRLGED
jgi:aliphatic nitrilase